MSLYSNSATDDGSAVGKKVGAAYKNAIWSLSQGTSAAYGALGAASSALNDASAGITNSANAAKGAYDAAQQAGQNASAVGSQALSNIAGLKGQYQQSLDAASNMTGDIAKMRSSADALLGTVGDFEGQRNIFNQRSDEMYGLGSQVASSGLSYMGLGSSLLNMDASSGGIVGEYLKYYNALSPDNMVSMAASDTQSAYQNAGDQALRAQARSGVTAGSGASQALRKQYAQSLATALAASKTNARHAGIEAQGAALDKLTAAANAMISQGNETYKSGLSGQTAANDAQAKSLAAQQAISDVYAQGGTIYGNAANASATQANAFTSALNGLNDATTGYLNAANSAYATEASAANAMSSAASAQSNAYGQIASFVNALNSATSNVVTASSNLSGVQKDYADKLFAAGQSTAGAYFLTGSYMKGLSGSM